MLNQVKLKQGIPFEINIPNEVTKQVMMDIQAGVNTEEITIEDLVKEQKSNVKTVQLDN